MQSLSTCYNQRVTVLIILAHFQSSTCLIQLFAKWV